MFATSLGVTFGLIFSKSRADSIKSTENGASSSFSDAVKKKHFQNDSNTPKTLYITSLATR